MFYFVVFQASTGKKILGKNTDIITGPRNLILHIQFMRQLVPMGQPELVHSIFSKFSQGLWGQRRFRGWILNFELFLTLKTYPTLYDLNSFILGAKNSVIV